MEDSLADRDVSNLPGTCSINEEKCLKCMTIIKMAFCKPLLQEKCSWIFIDRWIKSFTQQLPISLPSLVFSIETIKEKSPLKTWRDSPLNTTAMKTIDFCMASYFWWKLSFFMRSIWLHVFHNLDYSFYKTKNRKGSLK